MYCEDMTTAQNPEAVIANRIKGLAKSEGIALETIWNKIGLSQRTATRYMQGHEGVRTFTVVELIKIANVLGIKLSELTPDEELQDAA